MNIWNWSTEQLNTRKSFTLPSVLVVHYHKQQDTYARRSLNATAVPPIYVELIEFGDKYSANMRLLV